MLVPQIRATRPLLEALVPPDAPILMGDRCLDVHQWLHQLADPAQPAAPRLVQLLALQQAVPQLRWQYFRELQADWRGLQWLLDGITQATRGGFSAAELLELAHSFGHERELDLAQAMAAYQRIVHDDWGAHDDAELTALARARLGQPAPLPWHRLLIECGPTLDPAVAALLPALVERLDELHLIVPELPTLRTELHTLLPSAQGAPVHNHTDAMTPGPIELYRAPTERTEARWVAQQCIAALDAGIAPERLGVLLTHDAQVPRYWQAFQEAGLLAADPLPLPLRHSGLVRQFEEQRLWHHAPTQLPLDQWLAWWVERIEGLASAVHIAHAVRQDADPWWARLASQRYLWQEQWQAMATLRPRAPMPALSASAFRQLLELTLPARLTRHELAQRLPLRIVSFEHPPYQDFDCLFLPEATATHLPQTAATGFFSRVPATSEHRIVQQLARSFPGNAQALRRDTWAWEQWRSHTQRLCVSYTEMGEGGRVQVASPIVLAAYADPAAPIPALPLLYGPPRRSAPATVVAPPVPTVATRVANERWWTPRATAATPSLLLEADDTRRHLRARYADHEFSVTELEALRNCPLTFYARYGLGLSAREDDSVEVIPRTMGQCAHQLLAHLYREHLACLRHGSAPELAACLDAALGQLRARMATALRPHHPMLTDFAMEQIRELAQASIAADRDRWNTHGAAAFVPIALEWDFSGIDIVLPTGRFTVRGRIDRIDVDPTQRHLVVIDYKLGTGAAISGALARGEHLQLPVYLAVAVRAFPDHQPVGGLLFHLRSQDSGHGLIQREVGKQRYGISARQGSSLPPERWEQTLQDALGYALDAVQALRRGEIPWRPHICKYCDWQESIRGTP